MTNEERDLITQFIQRVGGTPVRAPGSVPSTLPAPAHPPIDREADALIADLLQRHPEARYRLTQMAFVQEHALAEAQNTINRLQWELDQARAQPTPDQQALASQSPSPWGAAAQAPAQPSRGLFGGMFAGRQSAPPPPPPGYGQPRQAPPPPVHAPGYQPGMFQQQPGGGGGGFLASALTTAAGVAGGMVVGNMLMNAFSGGGGGAAQAASAASSPWTNPTAAPEAAPQDTGWTQPTSDQGGWQDASHQDDSDTGWTEGGSDDEF